MPNFITHWLVADQCIGKWTGEIPPYIKSGRSAYVVAVREMGKTLTTALKNIKSKDDLKIFKKREKDEENIVTGSFQHIIKTFDNALLGIKDVGGKKVQDNAVRDNITFFSAYMLGACGPDFWTLPSEGGTSVGSSLASHHFDLGHYNRTHMVYKNFVYRLAKDKEIFPDREGIQARVAISYFMGLSTHFAADLIIHQLVNVSAGAYGLLEKMWEGEQGFLSGAKNLWNTHNKVEHYWDSYLRFRIFSDLGPLWKVSEEVNQLSKLTGAPGPFQIITAPEPNDEKLWDGFSPLNFPILTTLLHRLAGHPHKEELEKFLKDEENRMQYEKCYNFPHVFCDRMTSSSSDLKMFLYDTIVNKEKGAYPEAVMYKEAIDESYHSQFNDAAVPAPKGKKDKKGKDVTVGKSERMKLAYFASDNNKKSNLNSINYLNYFILPNLKKVQQFGWQVFYDLTALPKFVNAAVNTAQKFLAPLNNAVDKAIKNPETIQDISSIKLEALEKFWNLDTGLGLSIVKDENSRTTKEANTIIDFVHVVDEVNRQGIGHVLDISYAAAITKAAYDKNPKSANLFKIYNGKAFDDITKVKEEKGAYVDRIRVNNPVLSQNYISVPTKNQNDGKSTQIVDMPMWNRLNLFIRASIACLQDPRMAFVKEPLGFYFLGDNHKESNAKDGCLKLPEKDKEGFLRQWIQGSVKPYDFIKTTDANPRNGVNVYTQKATGVYQFYTHFLATVEKQDDTMKNAFNSGKWCNVVPYNDFKNAYGSNFAVGTGRQNVLHPRGSGAFDATTHFECYTKDISPTEFIYFSVHPLIESMPGNKSEYLDIITKKPFAKEQIEKELIKINWMGFVKIVLIYEYVEERDRGVQLKEYYIDGCKFNANGAAIG